MPALGLKCLLRCIADTEKSASEVQTDPEVLCHSCSRGIVSSSVAYVFALSSRKVLWIMFHLFLQYVLGFGFFIHCSFSVLKMLMCWFQKTKDELREISTAKKLFDCVSNVKALHKSFYPHELQVLLASAFQVCPVVPGTLFIKSFKWF